MTGADSGSKSDTKSIIGAPAQNHKRSASFNLDPEIITTSNTGDHNYDLNLEVTQEIRDDSVSVHSIQPGTEGGGGGEGEGDEDPDEMGMLESKQSAVGSSSLFGSRSSHQHIKSFVSLSNVSATTSLSSWTRFEPVADALQGLKFITTKSGDERDDWTAVKKRFDELTTSTKGLLHYSNFGECIGIKGDPAKFIDELFWTVARKQKIKGEYINKKQLKKLWHQIYDESFGSRLKTFFDMVDKDGDGKITKEEIKEIISLSASANRLPNIQKQAEEYADVIMEVLDPHKDGHLKIQKLEKILLQTPKKSKRVLQELNPTQEKNLLRRWYQRVKYFLINHWQKVWVLMLWLGIVSGLFAYKFVQYYRNEDAYDVMGNCVCIAKGAAETLKFNMALILLPVCRNTITWLRNKTKLGVVVPFDNNLDFHMVIAAGIAIGVILHGGAHLTCDFPRLIHATNKAYERMKPYFGEKQPQNYWWFVKGVEGWTGIIMVVLMSIAFTLANPWLRRNKLKEKLQKKHKTMPKLFERLTGFNAFWYSHHLFVIVYVLLIVHGIYLYLIKPWYQKTTWMYVMVPIILYACERLIRTFRSNTKPVRVLKAIVYNDVLALHMSKPKDFEYESGQYVFIKCSEVSPFEWHPFSITSAPGDDYLSVHIRNLGDWTGRIKTVFSDSVEGGSNTRRIIKIDGPYGSPARDYKDYDVVLLIGLGIGATPMISIVKDIINNIQRREDNLESAVESGNYKTKKVYFYWVTNKQSSFNWFKEIMNEVAEVDRTGVIELHNYCSSVFEEGDARSAMISVLQSLHHAKKGVDVVSETRVKSHFGKPNWLRVYKNIASHHPNSTIGVFYCGNPRSVKELRQIANLESSDKTTSSIFEFHKENF